MNQFVINGDNIDVLKKYPDNYFDAVVTDPPYGLGKEPNATELMRDWIEKGYHEVKGVGFMGKEWDAFVPQPIFWKEVFRVLKHGGHVVAFYGTRTYDWGVVAMRFAGFEVRDCIQWIYGSGFPKGHNISKAIDKIHLAKRQEVCVGKWSALNTALKPANEPIVLARKPLEKYLSIAENVLKYGTGGINIDGCRIETSDNINGGAYSENKKDDGNWGTMHKFVGKEYQQPSGRFPANIILGCNCEDENSHNEDCPIKIMDEQSGVLKSGAMKKSYQYQNNGFSLGKSSGSTKQIHEASEGYASRFFYCAKASKSERNKGLEGFEEKRSGSMVGNINDGDFLTGSGNPRECKNKNFHPTVKPIKLMQYLVRLVTPPNGIVLDPFCGSGTIGIACKLEGFQFIGIEQDPEYTKIAQSRIENWIKEEEVIKKEVSKKNTTNKGANKKQSVYNLNLW